MHYVYVIQNARVPEEFYIGFTSDLRQRMRQHNSGLNASTRGREWRLVYYEAYRSKRSAMRRERMLKHDGRVRRFLMQRVKESLLDDETREQFSGGTRDPG